MIALWMLYAMAVAVLLGIAALAAARVARLYGRPGRWPWVISTAGSLVLPALALLHTSSAPAFTGGAGGVGLLRIAAPATGSSATSSGSALVAMLHAVGADVAAMLGVIRVAAGRLDTALSPLNPSLAVVWALLSASFLAYLGLSALRLRRALDGSRRERVDGYDVLVSIGTGPAVVGVWRQRIVIPGWVLEADEAARRMILAHEHEHVVAGDPRLLASSFVALALMPWNPALWWQTRRLRLALELDCDARVVRDSSNARGYGALLLDVVERGGRGTFAATFAEPRSLIERRIRALTAARPRARGWKATPALAGTALCIAAACGAPRPERAMPADLTKPQVRVAANGDAATPFSFVVNSTKTGIAASCSQGCQWKTLTATSPSDTYYITDSGVRRAGSPSSSGTAARFSVQLAVRDTHLSGTCRRGCLWKTVTGTSPTGKFRLDQTGITPLGGPFDPQMQPGANGAAQTPTLGPTTAALASRSVDSATNMRTQAAADASRRAHGIPKEEKLPTLLNERAVQASVKTALESIRPLPDSAHAFGVLLAVDTAGRVFAAKVFFSSGQPRLDDALKAAYQRGRFTVRRDANGQAVPSFIGMLIPTDR